MNEPGNSDLRSTANPRPPTLPNLATLGTATQRYLVSAQHGRARDAAAVVQRAAAQRRPSPDAPRQGAVRRWAATRGNCDVAKALARLEGMKGNSMAAPLKNWLMARINILKQF